MFEINGDCYQFPPDALWSVFIPELRKMWSNQDSTANDGIKSFPFERLDVEQALFEYRDAAGSIVKRLPNARFRRCSCVMTGRSQVCVPPSVGWMCERPALLVRRKVAYEENMRERRRRQEEEQRIADASRAAEAVARTFLSSDDGLIWVRDEAERRLAMQNEQPKDLVKASSPKTTNKRVVSGVKGLQTK